MHKIPAILLCVAFILATHHVVVNAATTEVYKGVLNQNSEVVMELATKNGEIKGRYFYLRYGVDIPLLGSLESLAEGIPLGDLNIREDVREGVFLDPQMNKPRAVWSGYIHENTFIGTWKDAKTGKSLPFKLHHVATYDPDKIRADGVEAVTKAIVQGVGSDIAFDVEISMSKTPYDFLRVNVPLVKGKEVVLGRVAYRMLRDSRTGVSYPRLTRHPNSKILTKINLLLEQRHWGMNLEALACASSQYFNKGSAAGSLGGYEDENISVEYLSPTLMSVVESGSTFCGGAHPNNHFEPYTLDLLKGEYFDFSRILIGYSRGEYTPQYSAKFMKFLLSAKKKHNDDEFECSSLWPSYLYLHFIAPNQLAFDVSGVGHALGVCLGTHLTIPFKNLKKILKPEARLYLDLGT